MLAPSRRTALPLAVAASCSIASLRLQAQAPLQRDDATPRPATIATSRRDSAAVLRQARDAQRAFERRRRWRLQRGFDGGGRCDVRVGRFCYWYDESAPDGPPEPPAIAEDRATLMRTLEEAARLLPGDAWIAGQRVRYSLESGDGDGALEAARDCDGDAGWCAALAGLALHVGDRPVAADSAFAVALAAMPRAQRCAWSDISWLTHDLPDSAYRDLDYAGRAAMEDRFWWLATPFFARRGNDRRNEHYARLTLARLHAEGATTYATTWGDDLRELVVRFGAAERWSRVEPPIGSSATATVVGHDPSPTYRFTPEARLLLGTPYEATPDDWPFRDPRALERYSPPFARHLAPLPAMVAALRRDSALLVVASVRRPDDALTVVRDTLTLALARLGDSAILVHGSLRDTTDPPHALVPVRPYLASLEVIGDSGHAARYRRGVVPPPLDRGFGISELILFDPGAAMIGAPVPRPPDDTAMDATLRAVLHAPAALDGVDAPGRVGLYWELYGLSGVRQGVRFTLLVTGDSPGMLGRLWRRLRGRPADAPVRLQWEDVVPGGGYTPRTMEIALPRLAPGTYRLELHAREGDGGRTASAARTLVVRN
jgi:hypothetical protein